VSKMQRSKGRRGELEVLARLNAIGGDGEIIYGQEELTGKRGDVETLHGRFEVKRRASFPAYLEPVEGVRGVYCRRDRGEWLVVLRAKDAELLMKMAREMALGLDTTTTSGSEPTGQDWGGK
jgi:hypothetical protein